MLIKTNEDFKKLIVTYWTPTTNAFRFVAKYNPGITCITWSREFVQVIDNHERTLVKIENLRDVPWDFDSNTGLLQNGLCAIRIF